MKGLRLFCDTLYYVGMAVVISNKEFMKIHRTVKETPCLIVA